MVTDPVGDMLTQIRNAGMAGLDTVSLPYSKLKFEVASIVSREGFLGTVKKEGQDPKAKLVLEVLYDGHEPKIKGLKRVSKPGLRWYIGHKNVKRVLGGLGISILSTSKGIMTGSEAKKQGIGGEVLAEIW